MNSPLAMYDARSSIFCIGIPWDVVILPDRMKVRCPYCQHVFEPARRPFCPNCAKALLLPSFYGEKKHAPIQTKRIKSSSSALPLSSRKLLAFSAILLLFLASLPLLVGRAPRRSEPREPYRIQLARENLQTLSLALQHFHNDCGRFPTTEEDLASLIHNPGISGWQGPYILELKPDPWSHRFLYQSDGASFKLSSPGPDRVPGTDADLSVQGGTP